MINFRQWIILLKDMTHWLPFEPMSLEYIALTVALAAGPALILLRIIYKKDRRKPEPPRLVFFSILLGFASTIPALILGSISNRLITQFYPQHYLLLTAFVTAALIEEGSKMTMVYRYLVPKTSFDEVTDGILYTAGTSMGFAILENLLYSAGNPLSLMLLRGVTAVPLHATASGIMANWIARAKFGNANLRFIGLFHAVLIHGTYNALLFTSSGFSLLVIPLLLFSWRKLKRLIDRALLEDRFHGRS